MSQRAQDLIQEVERIRGFMSCFRGPTEATAPSHVAHGPLQTPPATGLDRYAPWRPSDRGCAKRDCVLPWAMYGNEYILSSRRILFASRARKLGDTPFESPYSPLSNGVWPNFHGFDGVVRCGDEVVAQIDVM